MPAGDDRVPTDDTGPTDDTEESLAERLVEAALEAERETGRREESDAQARRGVILRLVRMVAGFVLIGVGVSLLVLPGPGWVLIIVGLSLLPFAWAERTIRTIRRRIPGIPDDGAIPPSTWLVMGVVMVGATALAILFGDAIGTWVSGRWQDIWS
jgi:hypothetical protein